ncbi:MAG: hypothetical protein CMM46_03575 [Rhodospirillaceae bacterium]|nr:hypothetical protein [Rhodospirillaceae bacterium]|tara:strand:+ start:754 stop:1107 length:354 start_codon:yes stop_codon:yes gene_type:complete
MLEQARVRGAYRDVRVSVLGQPLDYADDSHDVAIICGVSTPGHAPPESFVELIRIIRSDGLIAFTLRDDETPPGFLEAIDKHIASGAWRLVACGDPVATMPAKDQAMVHRYWLFQVA